MQYETPEVIELGNAEDMIFGGCGCSCDTCTNCAHSYEMD